MKHVVTSDCVVSVLSYCAGDEFVLQISDQTEQEVVHQVHSLFIGVISRFN